MDFSCIWFIPIEGNIVRLDRVLKDALPPSLFNPLVILDLNVINYLVGGDLQDL